MLKRISMGAIVLFLVLLTFLPRVLSLSAHWSSDEGRWMKRSRTFVFALERGRFSETLTAYHPGVTTTWLGGLAIWKASGYKSISTFILRTRQFFTPTMLANVRFPIAILTGMLILVAGMLLYRLFGGRLAGIATLFLAIEPLLLAESRRIHTDALTAAFLFLTLLLWFCYLEAKTPQRRDLVFSGICFGFACLTKSHAGAFLLFLPLLLFGYVKQRRLSGKKMLMSGLFFCSVTLLTVLSVWPYLWTFTLGNLWMFPLLFLGCGGLLLWSAKKLSTAVAFTRTELFILGGVFLLVVGLICTASGYVFVRMFGAFTNAHELPKLFLGKIRYNPGLLYYPVMGFVWSAPLTVPLVLLATYGAWKQRHQEKKAFRITVLLLVFGLFYIMGLSLVAKKITRYLVIFLPTVSVLSAMGVIYITRHISKKNLRSLFLVAIVVLQVVPVLKLHPYYATYHFPLLPGEWVAKNTSVEGGVGLDVAAAYLNAKPNAPHLRVRASRSISNVNKYFVGRTWKQSKSETFPHNIDFDYDVEHIRDRQIQGTPVDSHPETGTPSFLLQLDRDIPRELERVVRLNGIDYVWIYRMLDTRAEDVPAKTQ